MAYKLVGKDYTPPDIEAKVTGAAKFSEDFRAEGMVFAKLLLSPMPHAKVRSIDTSKAAKMEPSGSHGDVGPGRSQPLKRSARPPPKRQQRMIQNRRRMRLFQRSTERSMLVPQTRVLVERSAIPSGGVAVVAAAAAVRAAVSKSREKQLWPPIPSPLKRTIRHLQNRRLYLMNPLPGRNRSTPCRTQTIQPASHQSKSPVERLDQLTPYQ